MIQPLPNVFVKERHSTFKGCSFIEKVLAHLKNKHTKDF
jgi:hypothetical protein